MSKVGKGVAMGVGGHPGISPVLQGSDAGGPAVLVGVFGYLRRNDKQDGGHTCGVHLSDHGKAAEVASRQGMVDTHGEGSTIDSRDTVCGLVHQSLAGNSGTVGVAMTTPGCLHM